MSTLYFEDYDVRMNKFMIYFLCFLWQNNKLEKIPKGAFSELSGLRELYLQNNKLTNEGMDNETFW